MRVLGITLARGGSKGIPRKNLAKLGGKHLIDFTIEEALKSKLITRYIVSTDDEEIANHSKSKGADVPFIRPTYLSRDTSTSAAALKHAVLFCEEEENLKYDFVIELMCTNPFKTVLDIDNCIKQISQNNVDSVIGVSKLEEHHPARIKKIENGYIKDFVIPETSSRRQDLRPNAFIRNGSIYTIVRDRLINDEYRFGGDNSMAYIMKDPAHINIDTKWDLLLADLILKERMN
tara:strand:- start:475 stop:1173 length:699 start_codon:yes stop_codon:yes gene_type:complete